MAGRETSLTGARWLRAAGLAVFSAVWVLLAKEVPAAQSLQSRLAVWLSSWLHRLTSLVPFPLFEILLPAAVVALIVSLIGGARRGEFAEAFAGVMQCLCGALAVFCLLWGVQYFSPPLAQKLGLETQPRAVEELKALSRRMAEETNRLAPLVPREKGRCAFGDPASLSEACAQSYEALGKRYGAYSSPVPRRAKLTFLLTEPMGYAGIAGVYFPFTAEPTVSRGTVQSHLPFHMAHEMAHSYGVAPEEEAGFSAFLACIESSDVRLQYSAALNAYVYANNALYQYDEQSASALSASLCKEARSDLTLLDAQLKKYEGPIQEVGNSVNDAYLKAWNQQAGVQSYGNIVDLLLAYYANK
ncbi:DUF3810 domain-containing protein [Acidaminobacterium chupaoyuni]